jgi:hypothetical protein
MKAVKTFLIGLIVTLLSLVQFALSFSPVRLIGVAVGVFFIIYGWKIGWTHYRNFTVIIGHIAVVAGCLVVAYAVYQLPSLKTAPTILQVMDMPLFWGLFTLWGGNCMITHGYCDCAMNMHRRNNEK